MADLIGFPFRVTNTGSVAVRSDGSEQCYTEELAILMLTKPGERELVPQYGISDPSFDDFTKSELLQRANMFCPDIQITDIQSSYPRNGEHRLVVEYETLVADNESEDSFDA